MAYLRASLIAVGITTLAAAAAADSFVDRWALERANSTETTTAGITVLAVPKLFSYCGADIVGGDIFTKRYPSPDDCVTNCLPSTGCNAGTWTRVDGGTCYFKRLTKSQALDIRLVPNAGAISFLRKDDAAPGEQQYPVFDVDMPGNDLGNFQVGPISTGIGSCLGGCTSNPRCSAYTWSSYNGGTCWLKSKTSSYVASKGVVSGIVPHERNAAACLAFM